MTVLEYLLLFVAAALGGALNSVAGGGSFISFPALVFVGIPPVSANATSAVALWPGSLSAAIAYRKELGGQRQWLLPLGGVGVFGGLLGALLLLRTSNTTFSRLLPFLLLVAALVFSFGPRLNQLLRKSSPADRQRLSPLSLALLLLISIYGGYFGGGMGMMILATFALMGMTDMHRMNGLKNALATGINLIAIVAFLAGSAVAIEPGLIMVGGATLGGFAGASAARRLPGTLVRRFVLCVAWLMTAYFFWRAYL